jgi:SET domain
VPLMDVANHADDPNAEFRVADDGSMELVARRAIAEGEEATVSYSGPSGYSNQRLMAQASARTEPPALPDFLLVVAH